MYEAALLEISSSETGELFAGLAAAQAEMPNAIFNRVNPHFKSQYADLAAIRDATIPALSKHGLAIIQFTRMVGETLHLVTILGHKSGQWMRGEYPITIGTPQNMGSQLTYARRYSWSAMTGVAADDDDDAEVAEGSAGVPRAQEKKSAYRSRKDGDWDILKEEMATIATAHGLKIWGVANSERIHALPDSWQSHFRELYNAKLTELAEGVTEKGTPPKQQLKASLAADEGEAD